MVALKRYVFTMDTDEKIVVKKSSLPKAVRHLKNMGEPIQNIVECKINDNKYVPLVYLHHIVKRINLGHGKKETF